jgi:hypothetical protein
MPRAEPKNAQSPAGRVRSGINAGGRLFFGLLDLLELLVLCGVVAAVLVSFVFGIWQSPTGRRWIVGIGVTLPALLALRRRAR